MTHIEIKENIRSIARKNVGPVMLSYVRWVLDESLKRNLKRLYFLARDGYLLYEIAKRICKEKDIDIDCRYLYCSRQSLRMPSYHLIGDEAYELLLLGGYYVTPKTILERALLDKNEIDAVCQELNIVDKDKPFSDKELESFRIAVKRCDIYKNAIEKRSKEAYPLTIEYFRQQGIFDCDSFAIVDSGWTGSMQRSLRQLLCGAGYGGKITGFYFGMYAEPKDKEDGEYLTFYFDAKSGAKRKANFNNNLFECMLSANHPMTVGYVRRDDGTVEPVFASSVSEFQLELIDGQISGALNYVDGWLKQESADFDYETELSKTYKLLKKLMIYPTRTEAIVYGSFVFCDDVTEGYRMSLADPEKRKLLGNYMLVVRVIRKLFKIKKAGAGELFWPYGVIAFRPAILRPWYRLNIQGWEILKAILHK